MSITEKRPAIKETVGAQYICFNTASENGEYTENYETNVERTMVVKSVKVTENADATDVYASGAVYDSDSSITTIDIEVEVIAFPDDTLARMRGDNVDEGGLIRSGGSPEKPFFAYGKVVKLKGGKIRYDWYPKCKLAENSEQADTKEDKFSEQTDTIKITAYPYSSEGYIVAKVSSEANAPAGLTEDKFFSKPVLTPDDLSELL